MAKEREKLLETLAGSYLSVMRKSDDPLSWFGHKEHTIRIAALLLVGVEWTPVERFADNCERLALTDPDGQVRGVALGVLSRCYENTRHPRISRLLAEIVLDDGERTQCRLSALQGLYDVQGVPVVDWPSVNPHFRFPEDVDWSFVSSCLQ